jgi:hypothetical protein
MPNHGPLIFIDTNIFLDFYRASGAADFKLLDRLKEIHDRIISSGQVEMEFQKNRHKIMQEMFEKLKLPGRPEIPGLFANTSEVKSLNTALKQVERELKTLKANLSAAIKKPIDHDPVYKAAKEVFSLESDFNLNRTKPEFYRIQRLARRRFLLGYPPRKDKDTSIGDAINWEWIVDCAIKSRRSVIIVSRDQDYGIVVDKTSYLNEWLRQEFLERVGGRSWIELTETLSSALKKLNIEVTTEERNAEVKLIGSAKLTTLDQMFGSLSIPTKSESESYSEIFLRLVDSLQSQKEE